MIEEKINKIPLSSCRKVVIIKFSLSFKWQTGLTFLILITFLLIKEIDLKKIVYPRILFITVCVFSLKTIIPL